MHERPHKYTPTSKHLNNKRHARIGKWLNTFLAAMWLVTNLAVFVVALEAMIVPKSEGGVFEKGNWVLDACKQLHTWLQDKDLYIGIMVVLDYSQLAVEMQQWASGTSSRWRFPLGFRAHELCARVLFSILPCVRDLEQDPLHNKRLPYTRREFGKLCKHAAPFRSTSCNGCTLKRALMPRIKAAAKIHSLESRFLYAKALRFPMALGLATMEGAVGYVFVRELLQHVSPNKGSSWRLPAAVPDDQLALSTTDIKAIRALFSKSFHEDHCCGFEADDAQALLLSTRDKGKNAVVKEGKVAVEGSGKDGKGRAVKWAGATKDCKYTIKDGKYAIKSIEDVAGGKVTIQGGGKTYTFENPTFRSKPKWGELHWSKNPYT